MKKLFATTVLALSIAASSFAADANKVNSKATRNFSQEFSSAQNVNWTSTGKYAKATFILNQKDMEAYYDVVGNLVGTSNKIEISELPTNAKRSLGKKYAGYTVKEAIVFEGIDETAYYISADNEKQSLVLKVSAEGFVSVFKKSNK